MNRSSDKDFTISESYVLANAKKNHKIFSYDYGTFQRFGFELKLFDFRV